jgi:stearoyl-CoA desaturase (delta-9 desaturase)
VELAGISIPRLTRRRSTLLATFLGVAVPPIALAVAIAQLWGIAVQPVDIVVFGVFYTLTGLGISIGFHRLFTHRSFQTTRSLRILWAVLGSLALQGPVIGWVTEHRKHHAYSDKAGDPHSPHVGHRPGLLGRVGGLWHAHVGWLFTTKGRAHDDRFAGDLLADRSIRMVDRLYPLWIAATFGLPFLAGFAVTGTLRGGVEALVWGGLVRVLLLHHATWSVNSVCHSVGSRPYMARDQSRNNWIVAVLTFGEGWHNNHHAFPSSALLGLDRRQLDVGALVLRGLRRLNLVWDVNCPDADQRARRRLVPAPGRPVPTHARVPDAP